MYSLVRVANTFKWQNRIAYAETGVYTFMARPTWIETDISAIANNMRILRDHIGADTRYLTVVKADAYGHGADAVLSEALKQGAWGGAVAIPEEGVKLREQGFDCPLLVLGGADAACAHVAVEYFLSQAVPDMAVLRLMYEAARDTGKHARVHIKLDTGMGRIGVRGEDELERMLLFIRAHDEIELEGVFTHFARADETGDEAEQYTRMQAERFIEMCALIKQSGFSPIMHICNSAGMIRYPEYAMDMVRMGVALYGFSPFVEGLEYAQRWVTHALFVKDVPAGTAISYGSTFVTARPSRIMTLPVGYADGYMRAFGNKARVLVRGRYAPVVGRVCMDQIMVDVTEIEGAQVGDEVVLMGAQGDKRITPEELADIAGTIPYEIMLAPSARVERRIC